MEAAADEGAARRQGRPARRFRFRAEAGHLLGLEIAVHRVAALPADPSSPLRYLPGPEGTGGGECPRAAGTGCARAARTGCPPGQGAAPDYGVTAKCRRIAAARSWSPSVLMRSVTESTVTRPQARRT